MVSFETIAALVVCIVLGFAIPIAAIIIYKRKFREAWLPAAFIGAGAIAVFALVEVLLYILLSVPLFPLIKRFPSASMIIGAVMAGVVEETARLVAYKTLMKNRLSTNNAVLMGLGFGGLETITAFSLTYLLFLIIAVTANNGTLEALVKSNSPNNSVTTMLAAIEEMRFVDILLPIYGRLLTMTFHVCLSVWVYKAVTHRRWLYPAAIALHAAYDYIAAYINGGAVNSRLLSVAISTAIMAAVVFVTIKLTKKYPDNAR